MLDGRKRTKKNCRNFWRFRFSQSFVFDCGMSRGRKVKCLLRYLFFNAIPLHRIIGGRCSMSTHPPQKAKKKKFSSCFYGCCWAGTVLSPTIKNIISSRATLFPLPFISFSFSSHISQKEELSNQGTNGRRFMDANVFLYNVVWPRRLCVGNVNKKIKPMKSTVWFFWEFKFLHKTFSYNQIMDISWWD